MYLCAAGMAQQHKLHSRDQYQQQFVATVAGGTTGIGGTTGHGSNSEKRKHRVLECDSDEDDFAGFDEDATRSENGNRFHFIPIIYLHTHSLFHFPSGLCALDGASIFVELLHIFWPVFWLSQILPFPKKYDIRI